MLHQTIGLAKSSESSNGTRSIRVTLPELKISTVIGCFFFPEVFAGSHLLGHFEALKAGPLAAATAGKFPLAAQQHCSDLFRLGANKGSNMVQASVSV